MAVYKFLQTQDLAKLENSIPRQFRDPLLCVKSTDTLQDVLSTLLKYNILAAPVTDSKQEKPENGTPFVGIISVVDLLIAFAFQPVFNSYDTDTKLADLTEEKLKQVLDSQSKVLRSSVGDLLGLSLEGKRLWTYPENHPLDKLFDVMSVGVHRVLVSHKNYPNWTFITQMDVLRYLKNQSFDSESALHKIFLQPISSLKLGTLNSSEIFTFSSQHSAIRGFRFMVQRNELSALPIVNSEGQLVDTLSASDFRSVSLDNLKDTLLPVRDFLKKERGDVKSDVVFGKANDPLHSIVDKILVSGYHRVWIVDNDKKPTGVVSLTDIIKAFSVYAPDQSTSDKNE